MKNNFINLEKSHLNLISFFFSQFDNFFNFLIDDQSINCQMKSNARNNKNAIQSD